MLLDAFAVVASFYLSHRARSVFLKAVPFGAETSIENYYPMMLVSVFVWLWLLTLFGAYARPVFVSPKREARVAAKTALFGVMILFPVVFFLKLDVSFLPRSFVSIFFVTNITVLTLEKLLLYAVVSYERKKGRCLSSVAVAGDRVTARGVFRALCEHPEYGLKPVGVFCDPPTPAASEITGGIEDLEGFLHKKGVDEVIVAAGGKEIDVERLVGVCGVEGVKIKIIPNLLNKLGGRQSLETLGRWRAVTVTGTPEREWELFFKRMLDIAVASAALVILSPLFLAISLAVKFTSAGPVFYRWRVVGFNKRQFKSWKFRTMVSDADRLKDSLANKNEMSGPVFKLKNDPRITPVGRVLRKFSMDELPQMVSVLKGDMSLVGPRPALPSEVERFEKWHGRKFRIKPGLTCLWQINGRNEIRDFNEWVKLDLQYIENWTLWLDLKILAKTIPAVLKGTGR
jgi:exopolysaccharide biosynthesis polyprenyl glycosylphosphotransferase